MPVQKRLKATDTFSFPDQRIHESHKEMAVEVDLERLRIQAALGRNALEGLPLLHAYGDDYSLRYWTGSSNSDTLHEIFIRPKQHEITIAGFKGSNYVFNLKVDIPGELVGTGLENQGSTYKGLYFSTERGQRHGNLFSVVNLIADAIVMEKHNLINGLVTDLADEEEEGFRMG